MPIIFPLFVVPVAVAVALTDAAVAVDPPCAFTVAVPVAVAERLIVQLVATPLPSVAHLTG